jgi:hypothetical protein
MAEADRPCDGRKNESYSWLIRDLFEASIISYWLIKSDRLLVQTKAGGLNAGPHLYALTWQPIDECGGKLDIAATGKKPYRTFKEAS